jgi:GNAT superfamily N-acetyltransferase
VTAHPLVALLEDAARGRFPAPDGAVEVLPAPAGAAMAVVAFTAHHVIAADVGADWVRAQLPAGDLRAPMSPRFLHALGAQLGRRDDGVDVVLAAPGLEGSSALVAADRGEHPRAARAHSFRADLRVFESADGTAVVVLGRGLALRMEVAIEIDPARRGRGLGTRMLLEARRLVRTDDVLYAQVAPGNAASLRAFLGAGFEPIGCEALFV